jgi:hypothetical protein
MGDVIQMYTNNYELYKDKFFVANSAVGTPIAINADPTAIAATEGMMTVYNAATAASAPNTDIIPIALRLTAVTAATNGTTFDVKFSLDAKNRYSSGGTTITGTPTLISTTKTALTSKATVNFGDVTMAAASSEKVIDYVEVHSATAAQVAGDQYLFTFGNWGGSSALMSASARQNYHFSLPPVFIERGCTMYLQPLSASASAAATFIVNFVWIEGKRGDGIGQ